MTLTSWLLYVVAVFVLTVTPGPTVLMCVSTAVNQGPRRAFIACAGSTSSIVGIMALSALGLGVALAASETLFTVLKWLGAAYLAFLGLTSLLSTTSEISVSDGISTSSGRRLFSQGLLVGASNPKALLFFGALFPQFINPSAPRWLQFLILGLTFVFFEVLWLSVYALCAVRAKAWLQQPKRARLFNRIPGGVFLLAASFLATSKRGAA